MTAAGVCVPWGARPWPGDRLDVVTACDEITEAAGQVPAGPLFGVRVLL
ncbi:hypothetical protein [Streptomyces sp. NPDC048191]